MGTSAKASIWTILLALLGSGAAAGPATAPAGPGATAEGGAELELFRDLPVVVSAARQAQPANLSAVPVSVVTAEDIHYSGLTNVAEVLQFTPGVDVLRADRNRYAVGVRGLQFTMGDRTLPLIDGRNAGDPIFGGLEFSRLALQMEDIERVEVVRGPGGAAWGANAFNGAINIITKDPKDTLGVFASSTANEFGDTYSQVRWGAEDGPWIWRVSAGYENYEAAEDAIAGATFGSRDYARNWRFDGRAVYEATKQTRFSGGVGYAHLDRGDFEWVGYDPTDNARYDLVRLFARVDHEFGRDTTGHVQWYSNLDFAHEPSTFTYDAVENALDGQLNFRPAAGHRMSVGGSARVLYLNTKGGAAQDMLFPADPFVESWAGLFAIDRWAVTEQLTLEGQVRGDYYSGSGADWSGRLAGLYALDREQRHVVRIAGAKAFRAPSPDFRDLEFSRGPLPSPPFPPGATAVNYRSGDDVENEETYAAEAGYTAGLAEGLSWRIDGFYQRYEGLIGIDMYQVLVPGVWTRTRSANLAGANAAGFETELSWAPRAWGKVAVWYAYDYFAPDEPAQSLRAFLPARHKAGLTARVRLPEDWVVSANYRWTDVTPGDPNAGTPVAAAHRLDLTVAKKLWQGRAEVMVGVTDLLNQTAGPVQELGSFTAHETPGRTVFGRVEIRF